jgi:hypothetical protein
VSSDDSDEVRRLIDRGLARYGRGELKEAIEEWTRAVIMDGACTEAQALIEFVRAKMGEAGEEAKERTTDPVLPKFEEEWNAKEDTDPEDGRDTAERVTAYSDKGKLRNPTVESPIPGILAQTTAPEWAEPMDEEAAPIAPMHKEDTRKLGSEPHAVSTGRVPQTSQTPAEDQATTSRIRAAEFVDRCRSAFGRGNLEQAVAAAEAALREEDNAPPPGIAEVIEPARNLFERVFEQFIGPTQAIPMPAMSPEALSDQDLDHRAGFILSRIDGVMTIEEMMDVAGMPRFEALRVLASLLRVKAIRLS